MARPFPDSVHWLGRRFQIIFDSDCGLLSWHRTGRPGIPWADHGPIGHDVRQDVIEAQLGWKEEIVALMVGGDSSTAAVLKSPSAFKTAARQPFLSSGFVIVPFTPIRILDAVVDHKGEGQASLIAAKARDSERCS
ncbi:MAG: hypothetical protein ACP6IT_09145 [Candidatus Thorarchaeota archaeon]